MTVYILAHNIAKEKIEFLFNHHNNLGRTVLLPPLDNRWNFAVESDKIAIADLVIEVYNHQIGYPSDLQKNLAHQAHLMGKRFQCISDSFNVKFNISELSYYREILFINRLIREIKRVCEIDRHPNIYKGNYDKVLEMITQNSIHRRDLPKSILLSIGHICL